jgi:hypothetical protein
VTDPMEGVTRKKYVFGASKSGKRVKVSVDDRGIPNAIERARKRGAVGRVDYVCFIDPPRVTK